MVWKWSNLLITKGFEAFFEWIDDITGDLPAVVRGGIFIISLLILLWLLYVLLFLNFPRGALIWISVWIVVEFFHLVGGGHNE